jgi:hydrogenase nickel incorporation protein HypB
MQRIEINRNVLSKNDEIAKRLRSRLQNTLVINFLSSPGSGKTTLLAKILPKLAEKCTLAVIVGDLRTENDADRLRQAGVHAVQIQTGDACHLEAEQIENLVLSQSALKDLDLLVIENIGNLVCPAVYDLGEDYRFVMLSVTEGEDKPVKYPVMFHNADYFILSKIDLLPYLDFDSDSCLEQVKMINSKLKIFKLSAKDNEGVDVLADEIESLICEKRSSLRH